jgi:DNA-binding IclR family transcriptional regulator
MDVPAETMRRKLKSLVERGWVERDEDGRYWPPVGLTRHFEVFNRPRFEDFRRSAARARALLAA